MPDLFVGGAAGPPGRPDWVNNAFLDPVKNDPVYLTAALVELSSLFFQDSVLPELRPLPTDPSGEAERRLAVIFETCFESIAQPGGKTFGATMPPPDMANEDKGAFFASQEPGFFTVVPIVQSGVLVSPAGRSPGWASVWFAPIADQEHTSKLIINPFLHLHVEIHHTLLHCSCVAILCKVCDKMFLSLLTPLPRERGGQNKGPSFATSGEPHTYVAKYSRRVGHALRTRPTSPKTRVKLC